MLAIEPCGGIRCDVSSGTHCYIYGHLFPRADDASELAAAKRALLA